MDLSHTITEQIQPAILTRLAACAHRTGKTVNDLLREMLDEREAFTQQEKPLFVAASTPEEWSQELRSWAASHPVTTMIAEDSRERIYEGRGE